MEADGQAHEPVGRNNDNDDGGGGGDVPSTVLSVRGLEDTANRNSGEEVQPSRGNDDDAATLRAAAPNSDAPTQGPSDSDSDGEAVDHAATTAAAPAPPSPTTAKRLSAQLAKQNEEIARDVEHTARQRLRYLVSKYDIFSHFMSGAPSPKKRQLREAAAEMEAEKAQQQQQQQQSGGAKRRMTEEEEDKLLLEADSAAHTESVHLTRQPPNVRGEMRHYQLEGLNWLIRLHDHGINGILADEMGLGKTLQTIALFAFMRVFKDIHGPHLVIAPKSTLGNWCKEVRKFCPDIRVVKFHGDRDERARIAAGQIVVGRFDVCVTSYEVAIREQSALKKFSWRYLVIDEAHRIKNEHSVLSKVVRMYTAQNRLLITGTPLQNSLHELWALLNFLLPDVFNSSDDFDRWFEQVEGATEEQAKLDMVKQLHAVLRPFLLRRLKCDVVHELPPKKETTLFVNLSHVQRDLYRALLRKDVDAINGPGGDRARLLNMLMQLRKCCNHPYLFEGVEDRSLDPFGDHVVESCGKLALLDKLLLRLRAEGHRVLIFCQMTRMLDILEDYCCEQMRGYPYCRIDGSTDSETREQMIERFNSADSDRFVFLLSTRAGGLGINLATADTVILYDTDWNPQVDLQAMDRAHRIGQKSRVSVFRLICESTVEERILNKAMLKLKIDNVVIQQGRLVEGQRALGRGEMLDMIRYGADSIFRADGADVKEETLDELLERGESRTKEMNETMDKEAEKRGDGGGGGGANLLDFKMDEEPYSVYQFEGKDYSGVAAQQSAAAKDLFFLDMGKRERRGVHKSYDEAAYYREALSAGQAGGGGGGGGGGSGGGPKQRMRLPKEPTLHEFQFFDRERIQELYAKERDAIEEYNRACEAKSADASPLPEPPTPLTDDEREERDRLLAQGLGDWKYREYQAFLRGCERHGRDNIRAIAQDIGDAKTLEQVEQYAEAFWRLGPQHIREWQRVVEQIEQGEAKIVRREEMERALRAKVARYADPWRDLTVPLQNRGKAFTDEEDRFLVVMVDRLGYGMWEELKMEIRKSWRFRFDWYLKSRTPIELRRRVEVLVRVVEKENAEIEEEKRQQAKARAAAAASSSKKRKTGANARRGGRGGAESKQPQKRSKPSKAAGAGAGSNGKKATTKRGTLDTYVKKGGAKR